MKFVSLSYRMFILIMSSVAIVFSMNNLWSSDFERKLIERISEIFSEDSVSTRRLNETLRRYTIFNVNEELEAIFKLRDNLCKLVKWIDENLGLSSLTANHEKNLLRCFPEEGHAYVEDIIFGTNVLAHLLVGAREDERLVMVKQFEQLNEINDSEVSPSKKNVDIFLEYLQRESYGLFDEIRHMQGLKRWPYWTQYHIRTNRKKFLTLGAAALGTGAFFWLKYKNYLPETLSTQVPLEGVDAFKIDVDKK